MIVNGYATLAQFRRNLSEQGLANNVDDDTVIEDMITAVSRYIDAETRRRFYSTTADETRTYSTQNPRRVFTDDIISVTTLKVDYYGNRTYTTTIAASDYDLLPDNAALNGEPYTYIELAPLCVENFPDQRKGVQIVGKFGYSATTPEAITRACLMILTSLYQSRRGVGVEGAATITAAGVVITPRDVPPLARKILAQHARNWSG